MVILLMNCISVLATLLVYFAPLLNIYLYWLKLFFPLINTCFITLTHFLYCLTSCLSTSFRLLSLFIFHPATISRPYLIILSS
jgi:hypothetical protein